MKTIFKHHDSHVALLFFVVLATCIFACTSESLDETSFEESNLLLTNKTSEPTTWQEQVDLLSQKMRRFHNFKVAQAQGYTQLIGPPPNMYVPNMGYHYLNPAKINGEFNLLEPEILVYHRDEDGNMIFGAAEYFVPIAEWGMTPPFECEVEVRTPLPDSFIGDEDEWEENCGAGGYTLHAWIGLENPMGVFHHTNPLVPASDPTLD
ncbi:hypothetical protein Q2T40_19985 [Winogradskyella maritima]|uniref:Uncharacterized protein n=1 Tax=Winogradskyella maritima TaxID=1517766 RepID=A0ABV8AE80_9FLAO|nr:hypothetical protein [Winogradskyella maritima]